MSDGDKETRLMRRSRRSSLFSCMTCWRGLGIPVESTGGLFITPGITLQTHPVTI